MLNPAVKQLPGETQAVYLQAIFKVYASAVLAYSQGIRPTGAVGALPAPEVEPLIELANGDAENADAENAPAPGKLVPESEDLVNLREKVSRCVAPFTTSFNLEVRERSCQMQQMLAIVGEAESSNRGRASRSSKPSPPCSVKRFNRSPSRRSVRLRFPTIWRAKNR